MEILTAIESSALPTWIRESGSIWGYATVLTLHTLGLAILVGGNAAFALRMLGFGAGIALPAMVRLFRAMWIGFAINATTGVLLFAQDATTIVNEKLGLFSFKIGCITLGVILMILIRRSVYGRGIEAASIGGGTRALAALSLIVWIGAITFGRFMAYPGLLFGL